MTATPVTPDLPLRLPAVLLRLWADPRAASYVESITEAVRGLPGVAAPGPHLLAVTPVAGDPGDVATAVLLAERLVAEYRRHLPARRSEEQGTGLGVLAFPGWVRPAGGDPGAGDRLAFAEVEPEPLAAELARRPPSLPRDRVYLTGYAAARLPAGWTLAPCAAYEQGGVRASVFAPEGRRPDVPWYNARLVGRKLGYLARPEVERALLAHRESPAVAVSGPLGCGKTRAVWQALGPGAAGAGSGTGGALPCLWLRAAPARLRSSSGSGLAADLLADLARLAAGEGDEESAIPRGLARLKLANEADLVGLAAWMAANHKIDAAGPPEADLPALAARAVAAAARSLRSPLRLVFDDLQAASEADLAFLAALLAGEQPLAGARAVAIGRVHPLPGAGLPEVAVPPMSAGEITALVGSLAAGLGMPPEVQQELAESSGGFPLALEEDLSRMIQGRRLRSHYGSFFYGGASPGGPAGLEPSLRLVQLLEADARAAGDALPLRLLAVAGAAVPAAELASAAFVLSEGALGGPEAGLMGGRTLPPGWQGGALARGWLRRSPSPWGEGIDFAAPAYARALAATVTAEALPAARRALGEVLAGISREARALWGAYRLLAGSPEALPAVLTLARDPAAAPPEQLFSALAGELAALRERGGHEALGALASDDGTELQLLWLLLPLARRLGRLPEREADVARALELAGDDPKKAVALASLKAELDLALGRPADGVRTVRGVLDLLLAAEPGRQAPLLVQLGRLLAREGRHREARELLEQLLAAAEARGAAALAATCRFHLGNVALREQRLEDALALHRAALAARREEGSAKAIGASLSALGAALLSAGRFPPALAAFGEAERLLAAEGDAAEESFALLGLGRTLAAIGDSTAATRPLRRALALREGKADAVGEAVARLAVAANHLDLKHWGEAIDEARRACFHLSMGPEIALSGDAEQLLGRIHLAQRSYAAAGEHFAAALEIHERQSDPGGALLDRSWQLELAMARDDAREALRLARVLVRDIQPAPAAGGPVAPFRLSRGLAWLRTRGHGVAEPRPFLERAYRELMRAAESLAPSLRHRYLFELPENAAILAAATAAGVDRAGQG